MFTFYTNSDQKSANCLAEYVELCVCIVHWCSQGFISDELLVQRITVATYHMSESD